MSISYTLNQLCLATFFIKYSSPGRETFSRPMGQYDTYKAPLYRMNGYA